MTKHPFNDQLVSLGSAIALLENQTKALKAIQDDLWNAKTDSDLAALHKKWDFEFLVNRAHGSHKSTCSTLDAIELNARAARFYTEGK